MVKKIVSLTLDPEVYGEIITHARMDGYSASHWINELLKKSLEQRKNVFDTIKDILNQKQDIIRQEEQAYNTLVRLKEDGRKEERELAEKVISDLEAREKERLDKLNYYLGIIQKSQYYPELIGQKLNPDDVETLGDYAVKMQEEGLKVGVYQLRELIKEGMLDENK